ncbi:MAG: lipoate--protein ligase family protein [Pirellulaceae bacterium]|nr:lipoate--protein ligase family protein [Pirellulaceae bacterium]
MYYYDTTFSSPEENLAFDEAILEKWAQEKIKEPFVRIWEPQKPFVVIGRSSKSAEEVNLKYCQDNNIGVFRRTSGGTAIVTGPGCLMYGVVLSYEEYPHLKQVDKAHCLVLSRLIQATCKSLPPEIAQQISLQGTCDLTLGDKKISGNSLRCKRTHLLYHGTLLYHFDLDLVTKSLLSPPRQPEYRSNRGHGEFLANFPLDPKTFRQNFLTSWNATTLLPEVPYDKMANLTEEKYSRPSWNFRI